MGQIRGASLTQLGWGHITNHSSSLRRSLFPLSLAVTPLNYDTLRLPLLPLLPQTQRCNQTLALRDGLRSRRRLMPLGALFIRSPQKDLIRVNVSSPSSHYHTEFYRLFFWGNPSPPVRTSYLHIPLVSWRDPFSFFAFGLFGAPARVPGVP